MAFGGEFAVSFLANLASKAIERVASIVSQKLILSGRLKDDLDYLSKSLPLSQDLLFDAAHKAESSSNTTVKRWLSQLSQVVLDVISLLDELEYELQRRRVEKHKVRKFLLLPSFYCRKFAPKIRNIKSSFDTVYKSRRQMGLRLLESYPRPNLATDHEIIRQTPPSVGDSEVVGREKDEVEIIKMVCSQDFGSSCSESAPSVVAIVGMGGLGKTSLAGKVYKSKEVVNNFKKRMWVTISENLDAIRVLNEMLQSLTEKSYQLSNLQALIKKLKKELSNQRFLLVLDDVWNEKQSKWDEMRRSLLGISSCIGSKILVTTRNQQVAEVMQSFPDHIHHLKELSYDASWALFKQNAFADGGVRETEDLVVIGKRMVKQCNGLPLAIKTLGGLLYYKRFEHDWLSIEKNLCWDSTEVLSLLRISFDHLQTPALKLCFAYCSKFPKGFRIKKDCLIQQWMALDLLHDPKRSDIEDIGDDYVKILLRNSLLQDVERDAYNNIHSFKMHDFVHNLAVDVSNDIQYEWIASQAIHVRSVGAGEAENYEYLRSKHLRVLVLSGGNINELPSSIRKLKHLRYLDISETGITKLPNFLADIKSKTSGRAAQEVCQELDHPKAFVY